nr:3-hydroxyacyl-CoA dehydrogenase NAD-binding domain-containing protein [uncultured Celeribacter sp.]
MNAADSDPSQLDTALQTVNVSLDGHLALIALSQKGQEAAPVEWRNGLSAALSQVEVDPQVNALVVTMNFPESDLAEEPQAEGAPSLQDLCTQLEGSSKPVVAAVMGRKSGVNLALAMAAHYRVMGARAQFVSRDVIVGAVPDGGLTQRVPRLCGAAAALDFLTTGRRLPAQEAQALGLVDMVVKPPVRARARDFARGIVDDDLGPRPTRARDEGLCDPVGYMQAIASWRARLDQQGLMAPKQIVECIEAALMLPFEAGLEREAVARADCLASAQATALRHAHRADGYKSSLPAKFDVAPRATARIGIVGTGPLAQGIAMAALENGLAVKVLGADTAALEVALAAIGERDALSGTESVEQFAELDLVLDASQFPRDARKRMLARVEEFLPEAVPLLTATDRGFAVLTHDLAHPERCVGLHFFAPAQSVPVVELVQWPEVSAQALSDAYHFAVKLGKQPVIVAPRDGLIGTAVQAAGWTAVDILLLMGVTPARIDQVMRDYGFAMGPCEIMDALGLAHVPGAVFQFLANVGRGGRANGGGLYDYIDGQRDGDATAKALIDDLRRKGGLPKIAFEDTEIAERIILAQANLGARLLEQRVVRAPIEIDLVMLRAKGFPRHRGGPMQAADAVGLLHAERALRRFSEAAPDIWAPVALWHELLKNGDSFADLNAAEKS